MSETCSKCKKGRLTFFDGASEHNPRFVCSNCSAYFEEDKFKGYLESSDELSLIDIDGCDNPTIYRNEDLTQI